MINYSNGHSFEHGAPKPDNRRRKARRCVLATGSILLISSLLMLDFSTWSNIGGIIYVLIGGIAVGAWSVMNRIDKTEGYL